MLPVNLRKAHLTDCKMRMRKLEYCQLGREKDGRLCRDAVHSDDQARHHRLSKLCVGERPLFVHLERVVKGKMLPLLRVLASKRGLPQEPYTDPSGRLIFFARV